MQDEFLTISILLNALIAAYLYVVIIRSIREYFWANAEGVITISKVKVNKDLVDGDTFKPIIRYEPNIHYKYSVSGEEFRSNRVSSLMHAGSRNFAEEYVEKYPYGKTVKVYYRSDSPELSALEPGIGSDHMLHIVLLGFLIFCFFIWVPIGWLMWVKLLNL